MSRISRYQESISRFIKLKSSYSEIIKFNNNNGTLLDINDHEVSIILLTIFNGLKKKKKFKSHESYNMAAGVDLLITTLMIKDSLNYYNVTYEENKIKNFINQAPIYAYECLAKNLETFDNVADRDKLHKLENKIHNYFNKKMLNIMTYEDLKASDHVHKTDIINYEFTNKNIINLKYKKLKIIDKDILIDYIERTYGSVCQCALVLGWLLGGGDEKQINNLERLGTHLARIIKLTNDFKNLERDITFAESYSTNYVVNYGIHETFELFDESKVKLLEGCFVLDIYNTTIKEIIDHIEKTFDNCLKISNLELVSRYTSFSTHG